MTACLVVAQCACDDIPLRLFGDVKTAVDYAAVVSWDDILAAARHITLRCGSLWTALTEAAIADESALADAARVGSGLGVHVLEFRDGLPHAARLVRHLTRGD